MKLIFTPQRRGDRLTLERSGDVLIINGEAFDFAPLPEGAILPATAVASGWIAGDVTREGGVLCVPLILPHGPDAPPETRFPEPVTLTGDGPVAVPDHDAPQPEEQP